MRGGWRPTAPGDFPTLGWQVLEHASAHLPSPTDETLPFVFTDEQARRVLRFYELDPETGEFVIRREHDEEAKGWGKSPFAAVRAIEEFVGPVCFDGWDAKGQPVGVPWGTAGRLSPWIQIAAVSEDQTDNTWVAVYEMLSSHQGGVAAALGIDLGKERMFLDNGRPGRMEPVTSSAGSRSGQRITFAVLDETHLWTPQNGGVKLAATIRFNLGKTDGRSLETSNAPVLGSQSVAEGTGTPEAGVLHYATRPKDEPQPDWPDERLLAVLRDEVYRDAPWVPVTRLLKEVRDPETEWGDALRNYFNIRAPGLARLADPRRWEDLKKPRDIEAGTRIGAGFDGSVSRDATVLRGCTEDGYGFTLGSWVRPRGDALLAWRAAHPEERDWRVPRDEVNAAVDAMFATFDVGLFEPDPPYWYSEVEAWQRLYGEKVKPLDTFQARLFSPAVDLWRTGISNGTHTHDGDPVVTSHVLAAQLRKVRLVDDEDDGRTRYVIVKGDDRRQIDGAIADVLALHAATTMDEGEPMPEPFALVGGRR